LKHSLLRACALLTLVALLVVAIPSLAFAGVSEYQVQFAPLDAEGTGTLIVNVILSAETKLPARVRVPLPAGATLLWSGEILGGDVANDPSREASITAANGGSIVEFTLEQVRVAQVEAQLKAPTISGSTVSSNLEWVNTTAAGTYTFSVRLPAGAADVKITPAVEGSPKKNAAGETLSTLTPIRLEEGARFPVSVSYRTGGGTGGGASASPILVGALVMLAIAVIALIAVIARQRSSGAPIVEQASTPPTDRSSEPGRPDTATAEDVSDEDAFTWD
jgi:hypothetical protein